MIMFASAGCWEAELAWSAKGSTNAIFGFQNTVLWSAGKGQSPLLIHHGSCVSEPAFELDCISLSFRSCPYYIHSLGPQGDRMARVQLTGKACRQPCCIFLYPISRPRSGLGQVRAMPLKCVAHQQSGSEAVSAQKIQGIPVSFHRLPNCSTKSVTYCALP